MFLLSTALHGLWVLHSLLCSGSQGYGSHTATFAVGAKVMGPTKPPLQWQPRLLVLHSLVAERAKVIGSTQPLCSESQGYESYTATFAVGAKIMGPTQPLCSESQGYWFHTTSFAVGAKGIFSLQWSGRDMTLTAYFQPVLISRIHGSGDPLPIRHHCAVPN
jgi:hypothetical protein